jgi:type I restriction enzyme M protein
MNQQALSSFLWSVADLLRGDYKQADYGKVILPFTVLRRLDCVLGPTKDAVLAELADRRAQSMNPEPFLLRKAGQTFYNTSRLDLKRLLGDQDNIAANLYSYTR